jgi:hypothetical protein
MLPTTMPNFPEYGKYMKHKNKALIIKTDFNDPIYSKSKYMYLKKRVDQSPSKTNHSSQYMKYTYVNV